ncbi:unnamed protein product [Phytophthora lilii]|uniref:Unnamed protein product n=1 Tax=Phytophthora lilii TaxID=2077276 RepID=A0A9W6XBV4_9STRA|nr:unnamed protein product [Phytophthora lilii]
MDLALAGWNVAVLDKFKLPLQKAIAVRRVGWMQREKLLTTLSTITNTVASESAVKNLFDGADAVHVASATKKTAERLTSRPKAGGTSRILGERKMTPPVQASEPVSRLLGKKRRLVSNQPSRIPSTPTSALKKPREGKTPTKIPTPHLAQSAGSKEDTPTYLEGKFVQLEEEKAALVKKLDAQSREVQRLQEQIQMMHEEQAITESRNKNAMAATMAAHAEDTATQQQIQYQLAEQVASQEAEIEELRSQSSQSSSPEQPAPQLQVADIANLSHEKTEEQPVDCGGAVQ